MKVFVTENERKLGEAAARSIAEGLIKAIDERGEANYLASTGSSQFSTFEALISDKRVDWSKVTMFHLDEYVALPVSHIASFRKYLKERFADKVPLKRAVYVNGEGDVEKNIALLEAEITEHPIDVGAVGIGENAHIAFNDPPANFDKTCAYHVVDLNETCKRQQVGEGWFKTADDVPKQAISMTPAQIMKCAKIVCAVPGVRKAQAIFSTLSSQGRDPYVPASLLLEHPYCEVYIDESSASMCDAALLEKYK